MERRTRGGVLAFQRRAGEVAGTAVVARTGEDSREEKMAAGLSCTAHGVGGEVLRAGAVTWGRETTTATNGGGASVFSGGRKKKASKGCFAKWKKYRGLSVNIKFPTILGLK